MHKYRWSDLEYVLSVAATGSVAAAARSMGVNHTTVLRRVQAFEETVNLRIFERLRTGYRPTPEGGIFLDAARTIETTVSELERKVAGSETALEGTVSVTSTDSIVPKFTDALVALRRRHPRLVVDVRVANAHLNLDRRESDIAVRASANPPVHLVGERICDLKFGIYATRQLVETCAGLPIEHRPWLGMEAPLSGSVAGEWMEQRIAPDFIRFHANSFNTLCDLAVIGAGHAILPRHVGDPADDLVRLFEDENLPAAGLWVLSHEDVLRAPRVRAAVEYITNGLATKRAAFEGRGEDVNAPNELSPVIRTFAQGTS